MRLLIISDMPHYKKGDEIVGWGSTVEEIDSLSSLFSQVIHIGCLYNCPSPNNSLPYKSGNVKFIGLPPSGGSNIIDKLGILFHTPGYVHKILSEIPSSDIIHIRCPANIPLIAILLLSVLKNPKYRWAKYAGNWYPEFIEPKTYKLQRWLLKNRFHRGVVSVNGYWPNQHKHIYSFLNPCLNNWDIRNGESASKGKMLSDKLFLLYVGAINESKGFGRVLKILEGLKSNNIPLELHVIGDGPNKYEYQIQTEKLNLSTDVTYHGWLPKTALSEFYSKAHFLLLPSISEGWPKVLSEGMAYGVVPLAGAVSSIPQILAESQAGMAFPPYNIQDFVDSILDYRDFPEKWLKASMMGVAYATNFTYNSYLDKVRFMLKDAWHLELPKPT